jgi:catechol 2,3-dioxygenase-like lactoylglutathione lyase family enzyme
MDISNWLKKKRARYTQLVEFEDDDKYCTAVSNNVQDARKLLESGFEFVCCHNETVWFRKRK